MRIGELAEQVGVDPRTIRYYESIGVLPQPHRTDAGYRNYDPEDAERLAFVRRATELNLQLDEIREILALREAGQRPCDYVLQVARQRIDELKERINDMQRARTELKALLERAHRLPNDEPRYCHLIEQAHASRSRADAATDANDDV
ncbi:MAG: heavy metal-responsive transcriptional regulator [Actinomycetota bacterium]|nr:heavy metal-responsive transcriptional regulator [Actinomycetota bacterium]